MSNYLTLTLLGSLGLALFLLGAYEFLNSHNLNDKPFPPQLNCGRPVIEPSINEDNLNLDINVTAKIMFGEEVRPHSYPWIVNLRAKKANNLHFCAGTLIHPRYVITAAHCVFEQNTQDIIVTTGFHKRNESELGEEFLKSNTYQVVNLLYNNLYSDALKSDDIALLKLDRPVLLSKNVSTICLPSSPNDLMLIKNKNVVVAGWGSITGRNSQTTLAENLQQTKLKILDDQVCRRLPVYKAEKMICALDSNTTRHSNVCFGDSGGGLLYVLNRRWYLYGVTSMVLVNQATGYCDPKQPSFYLSIPYYLNWITEAYNFLDKN